ncbi:MAG: DUF2934 domain-containing protein [Planctomycetota bacterium]|nr:DUF2934 domain-containing protein [Planctomycetota bacterium]
MSDKNCECSQEKPHEKVYGGARVPWNVIAARAHEIYLSEGRPRGRALEHWLAAERELLAHAATPQAKTHRPALPDPVRPAKRAAALVK